MAIKINQEKKQEIDVKTALQTLPERLETIFLAGLANKKDDVPAEVRGQFFILKNAVTEALKFDVAAAKALIQGAAIPTDLEPIRLALLEEFGDGG